MRGLRGGRRPTGGPSGGGGPGAGREDLAGAGVSVGGRENVLELDRGG